MKLDSILEKVIRRSGGLKPPKLGSEIETKSANIESLSISKEDQQQLLDELEKQSEFNNKIIIVIIVLYFIFFALVSFVVLYYRDSPTLISVLLGGSLLSLVGVITKIKELWREKNALDLMRVTIPNLSPDQAMIFIQSIYNEIKK